MRGAENTYALIPERRVSGLPVCMLACRSRETLTFLKSRPLTSSVSDAILKRVRAEHPEADVHSFGLMYVVGTAADTSAGAAVEPREVVMVFDRSNDGSGVRSRGKMVSYSVTDEAAPAVDLYSQLKDDLGDPRK